MRPLCWRANFVPRHCIVVDEEGRFAYVLGCPHCVGLAHWDVTPASAANGVEVLTLATRAPNSLSLLFVLSWDDLKVNPTKHLSPASAHVAQGRTLEEQSGVVFRKAGEAIPILEHTTRNAFWRLPRTMLENIAKYQGLSSDF